MESIQHLGGGFLVALQPMNLLVAFLGAFLGTIIGLLPGLGPINGVAILMPLAFAMGLPAETSLILLATVFLGCEYGGRISSILLNVPGDAGAIMTAMDGHPMAKNGLAGVALSISAWASFVGSFIAVIGMTLFAPLLAGWALSFGPAEYFVLMVFAFSCLFSMVGTNPVKTLLAALIGLALATVGIDSGTGVYRFTLGDVHLSDGIQFIVVVIGLFSVSEMLLMLEHTHAGGKVLAVTGRTLFNLKEMAMTGWTTVRSGIIGFFIGTLPGAGATIASAICYMMAKRIHDKEGTFGKGDIRGVAAPEAANNASAGGSFVPMLTLGVPGSGTTAVMMGALTLYNITPGPLLFEQQPDLVWGLIAALFIGNVMLLIMNIPMIGLFVKMLSIPIWILVPAIAALSFVGVYAVHASTFDLLLCVGIGVFAYFLRKLDFPMAPLILGFVLANLMEQNLRRAMALSDGNIGILFSSPIAIFLWICTALVLLAPLLMHLWSRRARARGPVPAHDELE